jgi:hypothetical protein
MGYKDREIKQLVQYANGLGIKVEWKTHKRGDPGATWNMNGNLIEVYSWPGKSKLRSILDLVHELAHHKAWINADRIQDEELNQILNKEGEDPKSLSKEERRAIYLMEKNDTQYRREIIKDLNLTIPEWRIQLDEALDIWIYYVYYLNGKDPTMKEKKTKEQELKKLFKGE